MPDAIRGNFITNRPDILTAPAHLAKHLGQSVWQGLKSLGGARPSRAVPPGIRPAGRKLVEEDPALSHLRGAKPIRLSSHESFRDLPMLTQEQADEARKYVACAGFSQAGDESVPMKPAHLDDAFHCEHLGRGLVPESIRSSAVAEGHSSARLIDPDTGLAASISFDPDANEVIIGFSGLGVAGSRHGVGFNQLLSCAAQWLGLVPKNMRQGSRIVRLMKEHVDSLNRDLPEGQKVKLTVTGFSMGGGVASYAALRNEVPAVVFNPMRLGLGARARVGQNRLAKADRYLTEVVVPGDWVSDNGLSHLYKLNPLTWGGVIVDSTGRLGNARRLLLPVDPSITGNKRHNAVRSGLERLVRGAERRDFLLPSIAAHWDEAHADKERAGLATDPVGELARKMRAEFPGHSTAIDALVETLGGITTPSELRARLDECGRVQPAFNLMRSEFRHLTGVVNARESLSRLPETPLREALGKDLQQIIAMLSERISEIHRTMLRLSGDSLKQFAINRKGRESEDLHEASGNTGLPHGELLTLDESLACFKMADDVLGALDHDTVDGLEDQIQDGAAMIRALQHGFDEGADHIVAMAARNARPKEFARDLDLCLDAEGAQQLASLALKHAHTLHRLRVDLEQQLEWSPARSRLDQAIGELQGQWLASALASAEKGVTHVERMMSEMDERIAQVGEQPGDRVLRTTLGQVARRVHESMERVGESMRMLEDPQYALGAQGTSLVDRPSSLPEAPVERRNVRRTPRL